MPTTKYTFWKLISEYSIEIPIIQRDYAQGRTNEKTIKIRNKLVKDIFNAFPDGNLDFDFVYGDIKEENANKYLIPLDGQQRLTTLFLLHWYLANKDNEINSIKDNLLKFTYKTRTSSREFCRELIEKGVPIPTDCSEDILSNMIKNASWFYLSWKRDPTIKAMLVMLDSIHETFVSTEGCFEKLKNNEIISFHFIPIENFGLTDNLYIKMNSRGKALTVFEEFKANFIDFLDKKYGEDKKKYFSDKMDGVWTDFFWKHKEEDLIDKPFMRYFYFVTEMLYYLRLNKTETVSPFEFVDKNPKIRFDLIRTVYSEEKNLQFLFNSLDKMDEIEESFGQIFSKFEYEDGKVSLFNDSINLFNRCIEYNDFGIFEKILLFAIIQYYVKIEITEPNNDIKDFIRVVRNLLFRARAQEQTVYRSYLRYETLGILLSSINKYFLKEKNIYEILQKDYNVSSIAKGTRISKEDLNHEIVKAKIINKNSGIKEHIHRLEDHALLKGAIHCFDIESNIGNLSSFNKSFKEIWSTKKDSLISRSMLTIGNFSINITTCALGKTYLFGDSKNWNTILTKTGNDSDKIQNILPNYLLAYSNSSGTNSIEKLQKLIDKWLEKEQEKDYRFYFIKYPCFSSGEKNYYSIKNDFEIRNLGSYSFNPLVAYHINPYVRIVAKKINDKEICKTFYQFGRYGEEAPFYLENEMELYSKKDSWLIVLPENYKLKDDLIKSFKLEEIEENKKYLLKDNNENDRIQIAVRFAKKIFDK